MPTLPPETAATVLVDPRFNGPPASANGGYTCGRLAAYLEGTVTVRLKAPPPLDAPLMVVSDGDRVRLVDGDTVVAEARPGTLDLEVPAAPGFEAAAQASRGYSGFARHWYPTCFVCGPERAAGDGLRIFAGPVAAPGAATPGTGTGEGPVMVAAPFVPGDDLAGPGGTVAPVYLWSALDCPGAFAFDVPDDRAILLGELTARIDGSVRPGDRCVVIAWALGAEGRKHFTGSALFHEGVRVAAARATWIEVPAGAA